MGDSGEGLIDTEARIEERREELRRERASRQNKKDVRDPERLRALESLRLARTELDSQRAATTSEARRTQIAQAIDEIDRRMAEVAATLA